MNDTKLFHPFLYSCTWFSPPSSNDALLTQIICCALAAVIFSSVTHSSLFFFLQRNRYVWFPLIADVCAGGSVTLVHVLGLKGHHMATFFSPVRMKLIGFNYKTGTTDKKNKKKHTLYLVRFSFRPEQPQFCTAWILRHVGTRASSFFSMPTWHHAVCVDCSLSFGFLAEGRGSRRGLQLLEPIHLKVLFCLTQLYRVSVFSLFRQSDSRECKKKSSSLIDIHKPVCLAPTVKPWSKWPRSLLFLCVLMVNINPGTPMGTFLTLPFIPFIYYIAIYTVSYMTL